MSAAKKPIAGQPVALSAQALADAYRAADIVLGKDGGNYLSNTANTENNFISVKVFVGGDWPSYNVGDAFRHTNLGMREKLEVDSVDKLIRCESVSKHINVPESATFEHEQYGFGIVRRKSIISKGGQNFQMLKVQIKGLVICRCLLFADAQAVGPPVITDAEPYKFYHIPIGNYYGYARIISKGRFFKLTSRDYPRIQECLINLG